MSKKSIPPEEDLWIWADRRPSPVQSDRHSAITLLRRLFERLKRPPARARSTPAR